MCVQLYVCVCVCSIVLLCGRGTDDRTHLCNSLYPSDSILLFLGSSGIADDRIFTSLVLLQREYYDCGAHPLALVAVEQCHERRHLVGPLGRMDRHSRFKGPRVSRRSRVPLSHVHGTPRRLLYERH